MGIVVCIVMLMGLVVLRPTPWRTEVSSTQALGFVRLTAAALFFIGAWNVMYGFLKIEGFWCYASMVTGIVMLVASVFVLVESRGTIKFSRFRTVVITALAASFLLYAVTLIQLNLGYPIL